MNPPIVFIPVATNIINLFFLIREPSDMIKHFTNILGWVLYDCCYDGEIRSKYFVSITPQKRFVLNIFVLLYFNLSLCLNIR